MYLVNNSSLKMTTKYKTSTRAGMSKPGPATKSEIVAIFN